MLRNGTVWLFGLVVAAVASGCVIGDSDDAAFVATWDLQYVGPEQETVKCEEADTSLVVLEVRNVGNGQLFRNEFECRSGGGQSQIVPSGTYDVVTALLGKDGKAVSGREGRFPVLRRGLTDLGHILFKVQSFRLNWSINRGNMAATCRQVDGKSVKLITLLGEGQPKDYLFPCEDRSGQTTAVPTGTYSVQVQLLSSGGQVLSQTPPMTFVAASDRRADLPPLTFGVQ